MPARRPQTDFRLFLVGQSASMFGSTMTSAALAIVAVAHLHADADEVSLILSAGLLPGLLVGPLAGTLLDRVTRPRAVLIATDLVAAGATAACFVTAVTGHLGPLGLAGLGVALGCAQVVVHSLYFSHLRTLGLTDLAAARGRLQASELTARSLAGAAAGAVVAALGAALLFLLDTLTYLVSAWCLLLLRAPDHREVAATRTPLRAQFADGVRAVATHPTLRAFTLFLVVSGMGSAAVAALRANYLLDVVGLPVALYTVPAVAGTLLGAVGALLAARLMPRFGGPRRALALCMLAATSAGALLVPAAGPLGVSLALLSAGTALPLFFGAIGNLALVSVISDDLGDAYFARVTTLLSSLGTAASLTGTLLGGWGSTLVGVRGAVAVAVALSTLAALRLAARVLRPAAASLPVPRDPRPELVSEPA